MEFNFRSVDERPPSSSTLEMAISAQQNSVPPPSLPDLRLTPGDSVPSTRELIDRQLEKDRIKEEIIVAEILRRRIVEMEVRRELNPRLRILEAEVRRELNLEREIALRRAGEGRAFEYPFSVRPFDPFNVNHGRFAFFSAPTPTVFNNTYSLPPRQTEAVVANDFKSTPPPPPPPSELNNKNNSILLAKPGLNLSGVKRKTPLTSGASELPQFGLKKKPKEEWSCAMCQVSVLSEQELSRHLNGKKHKGKVVGLKALKRDKRFNAPLSEGEAKELLIWQRANLSTSLEAIEKAEDADAAKKADEKISAGTSVESSVGVNDAHLIKEAHEKIPTVTAVASSGLDADADEAKEAKEAA